MNKGWRKLQERSRALTRFVCQLCDKPTPEYEAETRLKFPQFGPLDDRQQLEWKCRFCGAWHIAGNDSLIK